MRLLDGYTPAGFKYAYYIGVGLQAHGVYSINLPFLSSAHIIGLATNIEISFSIRQFGSGSALEPMQLEGDYSSHFSVFVERNEQDGDI